MAKTSGATQREDSSIDITPMCAEEFRRISLRELATLKMQRQALEFARDSMIEIGADQQRLWNRLGHDLSLDFDNFTYEMRYLSTGEARLLPRPVLKKDATEDRTSVQDATGAEVEKAEGTRRGG